MAEGTKGKKKFSYRSKAQFKEIFVQEKLSSQLHKTSIVQSHVEKGGNLLPSAFCLLLHLHRGNVESAKALGSIPISQAAMIKIGRISVIIATSATALLNVFLDLIG